MIENKWSNWPRALLSVNDAHPLDWQAFQMASALLTTAPFLRCRVNRHERHVNLSRTQVFPPRAVLGVLAVFWLNLDIGV